MTVHERVPGIVGDEIDFNRIERHDIDDVLHQAADLLRADPGHLERMSMQVDRMLVSAAIAKDQPVTLALLHHQRLDIRPGLIVDGPGIEFGTMLGAIIAKGQNERLIRDWRRCRRRLANCV